MIKMVLLFLATLCFSACGGGSGSSGSPSSGYAGNTNQAKVTAGNAKAVSVNAMQSVQSSTTVGVLSKSAGEIQKASPQIQMIVGVAEARISGEYSKASLAKTVAQTVNGNQAGFTGSYSYTVDANTTTGAASGSITFNQYQDSVGTGKLSGTITFSATVNIASGEMVAMNMTLADLSVSSSTQSGTLNGTISIRHNTSASTLVMSVVMTTNNATYWMKDLELTLAGSSMTISGMYYDPIYGYVVITTATPLAVSSYSDQPVSGRILFSGSNGTKAMLTYTSTGQILEVDASGNNSYVVVP